MQDPTSKLSRLFAAGREPLRVRRRERAFHPRGEQQVLHLDLARVRPPAHWTPEGSESVLTLTGVTKEALRLTIPLETVGAGHPPYSDLLSGRSYQAKGKALHLTLPAYGQVWLKGKPCG